jgi:hypothetical protein
MAAGRPTVRPAATTDLLAVAPPREARVARLAGADRGGLRRTRMEVWATSDWRRRDPASVMEAIAAAGIVAVLRASDASRFERVAKVMVEAGSPAWSSP